MLWSLVGVFRFIVASLMANSFLVLLGYLVTQSSQTAHLGHHIHNLHISRKTNIISVFSTRFRT